MNLYKTLQYTEHHIRTYIGTRQRDTQPKGYLDPQNIYGGPAVPPVPPVNPSVRVRLGQLGQVCQVCSRQPRRGCGQFRLGQFRLFDQVRLGQVSQVSLVQFRLRQNVKMPGHDFEECFINKLVLKYIQNIKMY